MVFGIRGSITNAINSVKQQVSFLSEMHFVKKLNENNTYTNIAFMKMNKNIFSQSQQSYFLNAIFVFSLPFITQTVLNMALL